MKLEMLRAVNNLLFDNTESMKCMLDTNINIKVMLKKTAGVNP